MSPLEQRALPWTITSEAGEEITQNRVAEILSAIKADLDDNPFDMEPRYDTRYDGSLCLLMMTYAQKGFDTYQCAILMDYGIVPNDIHDYERGKDIQDMMVFIFEKLSKAKYVEHHVYEADPEAIALLGLDLLDDKAPSPGSEIDLVIRDATPLGTGGIRLKHDNTMILRDRSVSWQSPGAIEIETIVRSIDAGTTFTTVIDALQFRDSFAIPSPVDRLRLEAYRAKTLKGNESGSDDAA